MSRRLRFSLDQGKNIFFLQKGLTKAEKKYRLNTEVNVTIALGQGYNCGI